MDFNSYLFYFYSDKLYFNDFSKIKVNSYFLSLELYILSYMNNRPQAVIASSIIYIYRDLDSIKSKSVLLFYKT